MIFSYNDFITESLMLEMINESNLFASTEFLARLRNLKDQNKIASTLYQLFNSNYYIDGKLAQNYVDVDTEDTITFLSDDKLSKLDDRSTIFSTRGRGSIRIGRFVNALLTKDELKRVVEFTAKDVEDFVNLYKATSTNENFKFSLVEGDDIAKWYNNIKYAEQRGSLGNSCMKNKPADYFDIYSKNPDVCKLLIYTDTNDKLLGRALVWKLEDSPTQAEWFMDRVYSVGDSDIIKFMNYAKEQNWMHKFYQGASDEYSLLFNYNGEDFFGKASVKLDNTDFNNYPYVDTLFFLDIDKKTMSNFGVKDCFILGSTNGNLEKCDNCNGRGVTRCWRCQNTGEVTCGHQSGYKYCKNGIIHCGYCNNRKVLPCSSCMGKGKSKCSDCEGWGEWRCQTCNGIGGIGQGRGRRRLPCEDCDSTGKIVCKVCNGSAKKKCEDCDGVGTRTCRYCKGESGETCPSCKGTDKAVCSACNGEQKGCSSCVGMIDKVKALIKGGHVSNLKLSHPIE